jgi:chemotaxis protein MotB
VKTQRETPIVIIRRKKRGHAAHHGGAWKVAFADFMTAMMALFLVLWLVTQSSDVKAAIAGYFQDPLGRASEFGSSIIPGEGSQAARLRPMDQSEIVEARSDKLKALGERLRDAIAKSMESGELASHVVIESVAEGIRISLVEDSNAVFFTSGSPQPLAGTITILTVLGRELGLVGLPVVVEGHTDARPFALAGDYSNWELSSDRANAARRYLQAGGLNESQVEAVRGLAAREPRMADPYAPQNRRVTILLRVPKVPAAADSALATPTDSGPSATP